MKPFLILSFLLALGSSAQPTQIERYDLPRTGLSTGLVFTADGTGWIVTQFGPTYRIDPGQPPVAIAEPAHGRELIIGPDGAPWGNGSLSGVFRIDPSTNGITRFHTGMAFDSIASGSDGLLWLIARTGTYPTFQHHLVRMDVSGAIVSNVPIVSGGGEGAVMMGDALWLIAGGGLVRFTASGEKQVFSIPVQPIFLFPAGNFIWAAVDSTHVLKIGLSGTVLLDVAVAEHVMGATVDAEGNLWTIGRQGLLSRVTPAGVRTTHGTVPNPATLCHFSLNYMRFAPDGRLAILKTIVDSGIPEDPCTMEETLGEVLLIVDLAATQDIPALNGAALAALAAILAAAGLAAIKT